MMGLVLEGYSMNTTPRRISEVGEFALSQVVPLSVDLMMVPGELDQLYGKEGPTAMKIPLP
jgi:hypothetical protein